MPDKTTLLKQVKERARYAQARDEKERAIIKLLPEGLDVAKVTCTPAITKRSGLEIDGGVDFEAENYAGAMRIIERLAPASMARVRMWRGGPGDPPTVSFLPLARVPREWYEEHEVLEITPVIFQAHPDKGQTLRDKARVFLEWYTELNCATTVNVRVVIKGHPVHFVSEPVSERGVVREWRAKNIPRGEVRRVRWGGAADPPHFTVYWWHGMTSQSGEGVDGLLALLTEMEGRHER